MDAEGSFSDNFAPPAASRLARRGSALLSDGSIRNKAFRLGSTEPPSVTLLKELLGPMVVVTTLVLCLRITVHDCRLSAPHSDLSYFWCRTGC